MIHAHHRAARAVSLGVGSTSSTGGAMVVTTTTQAQLARSSRGIRAVEVLVTGLLAATSLVLFASGRDKAGYALGVTSALWGAVSGAIRIYSEE